MIVTPQAGNRSGEQNPAYGLLRPSFLRLNGTSSHKVVPFCVMEKFMSQRSPDAAWAQIMQALSLEVAALECSERDWIRPRLAAIGQLQTELHAVFLAVGGAEACAACQGDCCDRGRHHCTLVNALGYLLAGERVPVPDFSRPCPYLGEAGCQFDVPRRPFNCVTFLCGALDQQLTPSQREVFYRGEQQLRRLYGEFDRRYAGGGLHGLLLRAETLAGSPFLARRP